jgi:hypothetical protein
MFFIFGWGKETVKDRGWSSAKKCSSCERIAPQALVEVTTWFTLFFIPVIPTGKKRVLACQTCGVGTVFPKEEFERELDAASGPFPDAPPVGLVEVTCPNSLCKAHLQFPAGTMGIVQCTKCSAQFDLSEAVSADSKRLAM